MSDLEDVGRQCISQVVYEIRVRGMSVDTWKEVTEERMV
jgi:hypothetical protein